MSTVFKRFDAYHQDVHPDSQGEYVLAQDAYDKVAVLEAQIQILKDQLKTARAEAKSFVEAGAAIHGQILYVKREEK